MSFGSPHSEIRICRTNRISACHTPARNARADTQPGLRDLQEKVAAPAALQAKLNLFALESVYAQAQTRGDGVNNVPQSQAVSPAAVSGRCVPRGSLD